VVQSESALQLPPGGTKCWGGGAPEDDPLLEAPEDDPLLDAPEEDDPLLDEVPADASGAGGTVRTAQTSARSAPARAATRDPRIPDVRLCPRMIIAPEAD
jgi:hypothetical protein